MGKVGYLGTYLPYVSNQFWEGEGKGGEGWLSLGLGFGFPWDLVTWGFGMTAGRWGSDIPFLHYFLKFLLVLGFSFLLLLF